LDEAVEGACYLAAGYFRLHRKSLLAVYGGNPNRIGKDADLMLQHATNGFRSCGVSCTAAIVRK
jgi:hypothetical protein